MKLADYSQQVTGPQLDAALRAGGFEGVFHYIAGTIGFALRIEDPVVVADIRDRGWPQAGIDIPSAPGNVNGAATSARAKGMYGCPPGFRIFLDIEPTQYRQDSAGWARAADVWCDDVRREGLSPGVYGTDETVAACANHADAIWRAKPGMCDPAGPSLAADFFAGRRIVQCANGVWGGVEFDVSYSQFTLEDPMPFTPDQETAIVRAAALTSTMFDALMWRYSDTAFSGPQGEFPPLFRALDANVKALLAAEGVEKAAIDALAANAAASSQLSALQASQADLKAELDAVAGAVANGTPPNLTALAQAVSAVDSHIGALRQHLGDTAP